MTNNEQNEGREYVAMHDLVSQFQDADQTAMFDGSWDPDDGESPLNQLIEKIKSSDPKLLSGEEREDQRYALWLWNHHAVSFAIYRSHDKDAARKYVKEALKHADGRNKITPLFALLLNDRMTEARQYINELDPEDPERETALTLFGQCESGEWFMATSNDERRVVAVLLD